MIKDEDRPEPSDTYALYSALRAKGMHRGVYLDPSQAANAVTDTGNLVVSAITMMERHEVIDVAGIVGGLLQVLERDLGRQLENPDLAKAAVRGALLDYVAAFPQSIELLTTRNPRAN